VRSGTLKMSSLNGGASNKIAALARMESAQSMVNTPQLLAAVDLGSNSFRLIVGRVEETDAGSQIYQVDALREPVRLA
jgi:exopolyphosphatase/guanosine-5'-triphosphate,3'-diphosphate pyrophosphatase